MMIRRISSLEKVVSKHITKCYSFKIHIKTTVDRNMRRA